MKIKRKFLGGLGLLLLAIAVSLPALWMLTSNAEATGAWNGQDRYHVPMSWCVVQGSPASVPVPVTGLNGITDTNTDAIIWRRHERPTDNIYANQLGITLRSAINDTWGTLNFPIIADPDTTLGVQGDMRGEDVNAFGVEFNALINNCDTAWDNLGRAGIGVTAVNANLFHDAGGEYIGTVGWGGCTRDASNVCVAGYNGRIVVIDNNYLYPTVADRTFPPSPADPGGNLQFILTDSLDQLTGHEVAHALGAPHRNNNFALMNAGMTDNTGDSDTDNINVNNTEITSIRSSALIVPGLEIDPPGVINPGDVQATLLPDNPKGDPPGGPAWADLASTNLILDSKAKTFSMGVQLNGMAEGDITAWFLMDNDECQVGADPAELQRLGAPTNYRCANLVAGAMLQKGELIGQAWLATPEGLKDISELVKFSLLSLNVFPYCADTNGKTAKCADDRPYPVRNIIHVAFPNNLAPVKLGLPLGVQTMIVSFQGDLVDRLDPTDEGIRTVVEAPSFPQCFPDGDAVAGGTVNVSYRKFPANVGLHALLGPDLVAFDTSDANGEGAINLPIPLGTGPGNHLVTIGVDGTALTADCGVFVLPRPGEGDHYKGYRVAAKGEFLPLEVELRDQFESGIFKVEQPDRLYNPAVKTMANGETTQIIDNRVHYVGYPIIPGQEHIRVKNILLLNQFGIFQVSTKKPVKLLVPSAKMVGSKVKPLDDSDHRVDHFKCYSIAVQNKYDPGQLFPIAAHLLDQFEQPKWFDINNPIMLCNPVEKRHDDSFSIIKNPDNHLLCYAIKIREGQPAHERIRRIKTNNQFGREVLKTKAESELCVPSRKLLPAN